MGASGLPFCHCVPAHAPRAAGASSRRAAPGYGEGHRNPSGIGTMLPMAEGAHLPSWRAHTSGLGFRYFLRQRHDFPEPKDGVKGINLLRRIAAKTIFIIKEWGK